MNSYIRNILDRIHILALTSHLIFCLWILFTHLPGLILSFKMLFKFLALFECIELFTFVAKWIDRVNCVVSFCLDVKLLFLFKFLLCCCIYVIWKCIWYIVDQFQTFQTVCIHIFCYQCFILVGNKLQYEINCFILFDESVIILLSLF